MLPCCHALQRASSQVKMQSGGEGGKEEGPAPLFDSLSLSADQPTPMM